MSEALTIRKPDALDFYSDETKFNFIQRVAKMLTASTIVPSSYQGDKGVPNCIIALEMANRIGMSPFQVMQNLHVIQGRPSWSSTFLIAAINTCGRFTSLNFRMEGTGMERSCVAFATDLKTGEVLESPIITMAMAKAEGWLDKNGSKWKTMPDLMLRYRAASFFSRLYAPEIAMGMQTVEEVADLGTTTGPIETTIGDLSKLIDPAILAPEPTEPSKLVPENDLPPVEEVQIIEEGSEKTTENVVAPEPAIEAPVVEEPGLLDNAKEVTAPAEKKFVEPPKEDPLGPVSKKAEKDNLGIDWTSGESIADYIVKNLDTIKKINEFKRDNKTKLVNTPPKEYPAVKRALEMAEQKILSKK